jgi:hypothetical protein
MASPSLVFCLSEKLPKITPRGWITCRQFDPVQGETLIPLIEVGV